MTAKDGDKGDAAALERLEVLVGDWKVEAFGGEAPMTIEWMLDGQYLIQRADTPDPAPDSVCVYSVAEDGGSYVQHYFDSRGVTRTSEMTLKDGLWTLLRDKPDFSPLDFSQRFEGRISDDGKTIEGHWDSRYEGKDWELDFELRYVKD